MLSYITGRGVKSASGLTEERGRACRSAFVLWGEVYVLLDRGLDIAGRFPRFSFTWLSHTGFSILPLRTGKVYMVERFWRWL